MNFTGAIFDLDGTLLDSTWLWDKIDADFLSERGLPLPADYVEKVAALSLYEAAEYTISFFSLSETPEAVMKQWKTMALKEYSHNVQLKPHALAYLKRLKDLGVKLAVATGLAETLYRTVLSNCGIIDLFDTHCSVDDVGVGKQSPAVYLLAAERLGLSPTDCIVFEDIPEAVETAANAGFRVFGVHDRNTAAQRNRVEAVSAGYVMDMSEGPLPERNF